jgi:hypothetical protein
MRKISNYHDLVAEKERVNQKLALLKRDIDSEVDQIKEKFKPIGKIIGLFGGGNGSDSPNTTRQSLLKMGGGLAMDLLVGPKLAKAGMITRMVVPPLLKGIYNGVVNRFKKKK